MTDDNLPEPMNPQHETQIELLKEAVQPVEPTDTMAEAGRKALLKDLIQMLEHEAGSRTGEDIEDVHDMRVATRRMRSTLRLLGKYYKTKTIQPYQIQLRTVARALGAVRDLDVLIENVKAFQESLPDTQRGDLQPIFTELEQERAEARHALIKTLDKKAYRRFVEDFSAFLTKPGKGALDVDANDVQPYQVRHLLPPLIYEHLAAVRAYDDSLEDASDETLHALRIEFKRLRYAVSTFSDVLGKGIDDFITELKAIQDHLGEINDITVAEDYLSEVADQLAPKKQAETLYALQQYIEAMEARREAFRAGFGDVWKHFNTKKVQRQLAAALAGL